jgi:hypothetical protein
MFTAGNTKIVDFRDLISKNVPLKIHISASNQTVSIPEQSHITIASFLGHKYLPVTVYNPLEQCLHTFITLIY